MMGGSGPTGMMGDGYAAWRRQPFPGMMGDTVG
jgi:hypothetical protein